MIEAAAGLVFALASGLLGVGGAVLFWACAIAIALVLALAIAAIELLAGKLADAWRMVRR